MLSSIIVTCYFLFFFISLFLFFFYLSGDHRDLHSFPTRRSSDLAPGFVDHLGQGRVALLREVCLARSEEHTSELQSPMYLVCRLLLEKKKKITSQIQIGTTPRPPYRKRSLPKYPHRVRQHTQAHN